MRHASSVQVGPPASITEGRMRWEGHVLYLFLYLHYFIYSCVSLPLHLTHEETEAGLKRRDH